MLKIKIISPEDKLSILVGSFLLLLYQNAFAQAEKIIPEKKLHGHQVIALHAVSGINPETIAIDAGTTVIWLNYSKAMVEIQFTGKQVTMACDTPVNFSVGEHGSFISDKIPLGAVASLCFIEKGTFDYIVKRPSPTLYSRTEEFKGKIIVR